MPIEKDAILGVDFLVGLAQIEAHTGQREEAVKYFGSCSESLPGTRFPLRV